eukprot:TRINITY_DN17900_c0_g1_i1.p1 TRINITY_DN17900_c0_g1~~TRINITY_DN17900_c0_g1_i1.p1  ORF type:complete len:227 (+),score=33.75 TRINITY_DN17900_c0_g1_i1:85-681(+)
MSLVSTLYAGPLGAGIGNGISVVSASATIRNSGSVAGAEVVQAYLAFPPEVREPVRVLRGFDKVFLNVSKSALVRFSLSAIDLSFWDTVTAQWIVPEGQFTLWIAASSRDLRLSRTFTVTIPHVTTSATSDITPFITTTAPATSAMTETTSGSSSSSATATPSSSSLTSTTSPFNGGNRAIMTTSLMVIVPFIIFIMS